MSNTLSLPLISYSHWLGVVMYHSHEKCYVWNGHSIPMWNIHIYNIEHRNLETRKTLTTFFGQVRNFLLPFILKVLRHKERDTHSFYSGFFICTPHLVRHVPKASASKWKSTVFSRGRSQTLLTDFFKILKSSMRFQCVMSFTFASPVSHLGYCDISERHVCSVCTREHLC